MELGKFMLMRYSGRAGGTSVCARALSVTQRQMRRKRTSRSKVGELDRKEIIQGRSSTFRRKMRPGVKLFKVMKFRDRAAASRRCPIPLRGPLVQRFGAPLCRVEVAANADIARLVVALEQNKSGWICPEPAATLTSWQCLQYEQTGARRCWARADGKSSARVHLAAPYTS